MEEARAYEELRVGFTAAVSHELRTPLARLLALLESASLPNADRDALLAQATEEVEEMSELVDDVLFLSELESGREVVALGSTPALPVLKEARDRLANRAENADVTMRIEAPGDVELPLRRRMLQIVVENLAENSIRYAGPGSSEAGSSTRTAVPASGSLSTANRPPRASTRSLSPTRPDPRSKAAPPMPSSRTPTRRMPSSISTSTLTEEAFACLAAFVSVSETT